MNVVKKIVLIGPESTGKSTLCNQLAVHYKTKWCPEYARNYLERNGKIYTYENLLEIAKGQLELEDKYELKVKSQKLKTNIQQETRNKKREASNIQNPTLFLDTDMIVMKVWCEFVFEKCHDFINEEITKRKYDLYLLCNIDLPWIKDNLREYPDDKPRKELFEIYKNILENQTTPWQLISGFGDDRLQHAIHAVNEIMGHNPPH